MKTPAFLGSLAPLFRRRLKNVSARLSPRLFAARVDHVTDVCRRAARGDLEARIQGADPKTSWGRMCASINHVLDTSDAFVREAAAAMDNCSHDRFHRPILQRGMHGSYAQSAGTINAAAARMRTHSENIRFVAAQAVTTANDVHTVAAACEELNATTSEISGQTNDATGRARAVVEQLGGVNETFNQLQDAVTKIDRVVELLNSVAFQTQLLGLNATIEAAHAGQYGSSFAVVAGEVKSLSDETRKASEEIGLELAEIKSRTHEAARNVAEITRMIHEFETSTAAIDTSLQEQLKAASAINKSISSVSEKSEEISQRINDSRAER